MAREWLSFGKSRGRAYGFVMPPVTLALGAVLAPISMGRAQVRIDVDATMEHQAMEGFGASTISLAYGAKDNVPQALRTRALEAL